MHLTCITDYGLRALIYLALRPDELASMKRTAGSIQAFNKSP